MGGEAREEEQEERHRHKMTRGNREHDRQDSDPQPHGQRARDGSPNRPRRFEFESLPTSHETLIAAAAPAGQIEADSLAPAGTPGRVGSSFDR